MAVDTVADTFYFAGRIRNPGEPVEVENATDRRALLDRGLIVEGKADLDPAPQNKARLSAPDNKSRGSSGK